MTTKEKKSSTNSNENECPRSTNKMTQIRGYDANFRNCGWRLYSSSGCNPKGLSD